MLSKEGVGALEKDENLEKHGNIIKNKEKLDIKSYQNGLKNDKLYSKYAIIKYNILSDIFSDPRKRIYYEYYEYS